MSATSQHGFHPDAESLSAFAEQALSERERAGVLAHLAVCGRCRQVVTLAREAADADARPRKSVARHLWWKSWQIAWIPAAALAATAALAVYMHVRNVERSAEMARLEPQAAAPHPQTAANPPHQDNAESTPPGSSAPGSPQSAKQTHSAEAEHYTGRQPDSGKAQESRSGTTKRFAMDRVEPAPEAPMPPPPGAQQALPEPEGQNEALPAAQPADAARETEQKQSEEQRQAKVETSRQRFMAAQAAPEAKAPPEDGSVHGANHAATPTATEAVTVTNAAPLVETAPQPAAPTLSAKVQAPWRGSPLIRQIHLPSGLAVVSSTSTGPLMLAIDKAGALFVSEDQGGTWERVTTQWTGRAVEVTQQYANGSGSQTAPAAQAQTGDTPTGGNRPAGAAAPHESPLIFELLNDKNQAWVSTDGRTWTVK